MTSRRQDAEKLEDLAIESENRGEHDDAKFLRVLAKNARRDAAKSGELTRDQAEICTLMGVDSTKVAAMFKNGGNPNIFHPTKGN